MRLRIRRERDINHHSRFFKSPLLGSAADGNGKGKIILYGDWIFRNGYRSGRRLAVRGIERKSRLSRIRRELSPLAAIGIEAFREFAAPGNALLCLTGDTRGPCGVIVPGRAMTRVSARSLSRGNS